MGYTKVDEPVSVLGVFQNSSFIPKKFKWHNRSYPVEKVTSTHVVEDGRVAKRCYAILSQGNLYLLEYNRTSESWKLSQVWYEG